MISDSSQLLTFTRATLILTIVNWVYRPHTMHHILFPWLSCFVYVFPTGLWRQLWHAPNHIGIPLEKVRLLEIFKINIRQISTQIICLYLNVGPMSLWLIVVVARLGLMVICWNGSYKCISLLEPTIHPFGLVPLIIKVTMLHGKFELWRLQVIVPVCHWVAFLVLWNFWFVFRLILIYNQFIVVVFWCECVLRLWIARAQSSLPMYTRTHKTFCLPR